MVKLLKSAINLRRYGAFAQGKRIYILLFKPNPILVIFY